MKNRLINNKGSLMTKLLISLAGFAIIAIVIIILFSKKDSSIDNVTILNDAIDTNIKEVMKNIENSNLRKLFNSLAYSQNTIDLNLKMDGSIVTNDELLGNTFDLTYGYDKINNKYGLKINASNSTGDLKALLFNIKGENYLRLLDGYNMNVHLNKITDILGNLLKDIDKYNVESLNSLIKYVDHYNIDYKTFKTMITDIKIAIMDNVNAKKLTYTKNNDSSSFTYTIDNDSFVNFENSIDKILMKEENLIVLSKLTNKTDNDIIDYIEDETKFNGNMIFKVILDKDNKINKIIINTEAKINSDNKKSIIEITIKDNTYLMSYSDELSEISYKIYFDLENKKIKYDTNILEIDDDGSESIEITYDISEDNDTYKGSINIKNTEANKTNSSNYTMNIGFNTYGSFNMNFPMILARNTIEESKALEDNTFTDYLKNNAIIGKRYNESKYTNDELDKISFTNDVEKLMNLAETSFNENTAIGCYKVSTLLPGSTYGGCVTVSKGTSEALLSTAYIYNGKYQTYDTLKGTTHEELSLGKTIINQYISIPNNFCPNSCK